MSDKKLEDPKNLSDKGLLAAHHYAHVVFKLTQNGAESWGLFADFQDIFNYHSKIVEEMEKRGFSHIFQDKGLDDLDALKSVKSVLDDSFLKLAKWDVAHPKTLTWLKASASIVKFLKEGTVLELGCSGGGLLESLAFSGFVVSGVDSDEKAADVALLRGLNVTNADALCYLESQKEDSYDVICSSHFLEHVQDPVKVLSQIEKVAKLQSIHVVPLGKGLCEDHITEWGHLAELEEWLIKNNLNYYIEQNEDCAVLVKNLNLSPVFGPFEGLRPLTLIPDYVSVVGSTVKAEHEPNDLDILIRSSERDEGLELQLTKQIRNLGYGGELEFVYTSAGPHGDYLPLFNNTLQKVVNLEVKKVTSPVSNQPDESKAAIGFQLGEWFSPLKPAKSFTTIEECWADWGSFIVEKGVSVSIEMKLDGYRARLVGKEVPKILGPQSGEDYTKALPSIVEELKKTDALFDSEILLYDKGGIVSREDLAVLFSKDPKAGLKEKFVIAWIFDALMLDDKWIDTKPYSERRHLLSEWFKGKNFKYLKLLPSFPANDREHFLEYASKVSDVEGSEGAIFKDSSSIYEFAQVTSDWAKVKSVTEVFCEVVSRDEVEPVSDQPTKWVYQLAVQDNKGGQVMCGNSMATVEDAMPGQIIEVRINRVWKSDGEYSFLFPILIEVRRDKDKPSTTGDLDKLVQQFSPVKSAIISKVYQLLRDAVIKVFKSEKKDYYGFTQDVVKSMTDRAVEELERAGLFDKDSDYGGMIGKAVEKLLRVFQQQGHSGFSAGLVSSLFYKLCKGQVLSPLTVKKEEWANGGEGFLQNKRCFNVFSTPKDLQKGRAYTLDGIVWIDKDGSSYTDINSRVWFDLPGFPPETEYLESPEEDTVKFYITVESIKRLMKISQPILADEGGEVGEGVIKNTVGLIKTGDVGKWVLQLHDVRTLHADLRFEIPSKPGWLAKYTLFIPNRVIGGERYGATALKAAGPKVLKYLLEEGHLAGNVTPQLVPDPWLHVGRTGVETFAAGDPGGSPNKEGQMLAIDYGTFEAIDSFTEHHSASYLLKGEKIKNRILLVVGVKPTELRLEDPELAGVAKRVWLFSLLKEKSEGLKKNFKVGWTSESRAGAAAVRGKSVVSPVSRKEMEKKYGKEQMTSLSATTLKHYMFKDLLSKDSRAAAVGAVVMSDWRHKCSSEGGCVLQGVAAKRWGEGKGVSAFIRDDINKKMSKTLIDKSATDRFMSWEKESTGYLMDRVIPGKTSVTLYRGTSKVLKGNVSARLNSLSSWTSDRECAKIFADVKGGSILKATVKKSRVFSCFQGAEREFIVIGNKDLKARVVS